MKDENQHCDVAVLFAATGGGVQKMHVLMSNEIVRRGYRVDCWMPEAKGPYLTQLLPEIRLKVLNSRHPIAVFRGILRYLKRERPRAVLAAQEHIGSVSVIARWLSGMRFPLLVSSHIDFTGMRRDSRLLMRCLPFLVWLAFPSADHIVTVSRGNERDLKAFLRRRSERISTIYNAVVHDDLHEKAARSPGHPWLDELGDVPVLLSVGNLVPQKDVPTLLRAFARLRQQRPARLIVAGTGYEADQYQNLARQLEITEDVDFIGFVDNPYAYMARSSLFVCSSAWEGFGNVIVEALACGCPVVSTDCPSGPSEILADGTFGRLVPVGDDAALAEAIAATLAAPPDRNWLRQRGAHFTVERAIDQYLDMLGLERSVPASPALARRTA